MWILLSPTLLYKILLPEAVCVAICMPPTRARQLGMLQTDPNSQLKKECRQQTVISLLTHWSRDTSRMQPHCHRTLCCCSSGTPCQLQNCTTQHHLHTCACPPAHAQLCTHTQPLHYASCCSCTDGDVDSRLAYTMLLHEQVPPAPKTRCEACCAAAAAAFGG